MSGLVGTSLLAPYREYSIEMRLSLCIGTAVVLEFSVILILIFRPHRDHSLVQGGVLDSCFYRTLILHNKSRDVVAHAAEFWLWQA